MSESNSKLPSPDDGEPDASEIRLKGDALDGAEQKSSVDHTDYKKSRNPDTELRLDGEDDSLYNDGLDVRDVSESYAGTDGDGPKGYKG
jgi:hypothetical protein